MLNPPPHLVRGTTVANEPNNTPPPQQTQPAAPAQPATSAQPPTQQADPSQGGQPFVHPTLGTLAIKGTDPSLPIRAADPDVKHG